MAASDGSAAEIDIVAVEPRLAAVVRKDVPLADMPTAQRDARRVLDAAFQAAGIRPAGDTMTMWRPPRDGAIDYAPGVFVAESFEADSAVSFVMLPGGRAVHLRLDGGYEQLPGAWQRIFAFCAAQGHPLAGENWEIYAPAGDTGSVSRTDLYALLR